MIHLPDIRVNFCHFFFMWEFFFVLSAQVTWRYVDRPMHALNEDR